MYIAGSRVVREKRSRIVKYFETADKGCSAVVYPEAVHFKENGEWKEIDHILVEDEKDDIRAFQLEEDGSP